MNLNSVSFRIRTYTCAQNVIIWMVMHKVYAWKKIFFAVNVRKALFSSLSISVWTVYLHSLSWSSEECLLLFYSLTFYFSFEILHLENVFLSFVFLNRWCQTFADNVCVFNFLSCSFIIYQYFISSHISNFRNITDW